MRAKSDDGLRGLFCEHLPAVHWTRIETGLVEPGVPDLNGCHRGVEFWVEMKSTGAWKIGTFAPAQVAWIERRARCGGRCFVAVRQGGSTRDALWLFSYRAARALFDGARVDELVNLGKWDGGPSRWAWASVLDALVAT